MPKVNLNTTPDQFHGLHKALDGTRASSKIVKVDREALNNLLQDHSRVLARLNGDYTE